MKEYTVLAVLSVLIAALLDYKLKTRVLRRPLFYFFIPVILFFQFFVNGYISAGNIVMYSPYSVLGVRIGAIPLEDFLFGFSMVAMSVIFWEYAKTKGL